MEQQWQTLELLREDHTGLIILNRTEVLNAINTRMLQELLEVLQILSYDNDIWVAAITGAGDRAFSAGADLKERHHMTGDDLKYQRSLFVRACRAVMDFPKPLLAAVNGLALGGGFELALACDFIMASEKAVFALPEVGLGVIPAAGGTQNLPRIIGKHKAKELIFTGRRLTAAEAFEWGIVNYVVPDEQLLTKTKEMLGLMLQKAPLALRQAKKAIDVGLEIGLDAAIVLEAECYNNCLQTEDRQEGLRAFNEKRAPVFKGR